MDVVGHLPPPPPPFNRLPPDGHEFPQKYTEEMPVLAPTVDPFKVPAIPPLPTTEPPRRSLVGTLPGKGKDWRQDERSGKSVRDKIAMFQSVPDSPVSPASSSGFNKLSKYKSSDDVFCDEEDRSVKPFSRSVISMDKLGGRVGSSFSSTGDSGSEFGARTQSSLDLTSCSSSAYSSSCSPDSSLSSTTSSYLGYASTLPRKANTTETIKSEKKPKAVTRTSSFNVYNRSQSMLDINPLPYKRPKDGSKQTLNSLVETRRKTMSKLRGLVIPDKSVESPNQSILDLPEIKSKDLLVNKVPSFEKERRTSLGSYPSSRPTPVAATNLSTPPWKMQNQTPAVPKYSPAFKRKNISLYSSSHSDFSSQFSPSLNAPNKPPRSNGLSPRYSLDSSKPIKPDSSTDRVESIFKNSLTRPNDFPKGLDFYGRKCMSDRGRSEEDSDNDSAVSSSRSSISPPASPLLGGHHGLISMEIEKTPLARTLSSETTASGTSTASTLTSGSHASCGSDSDSHSKRILKAQSVEAINRKNVLTSAKYSRGFDVKNGSPLIKRKLAEDGLAEKITDCLELNNEPFSRKLSSDNSTNDIICYKLADEYESNNRVPEVKIAFLNHVEYEVVDILKKQKLEKAEGEGMGVSYPAFRRLSAPAPAAPVPAPVSSSLWTDWNEHSPLAPKISTESTRSRASSAETVVERPLTLAAQVVPSRIRTVECEGNFLDDVDSCLEDSDSGLRPIAWPKEAEHQFAVPQPVHKRAGSGLTEDETEVEKRSKLVAERMAARNRRSVSVNDIRKAFEKAEISVSSKADSMKTANCHARVSSLDSTTSDDSMMPYDSNLSREQFGSITSLASSTSLISPQELQSLIDEANLTLEETTGMSGSYLAGSHDVLVVILHRDSVGGSVGITLAGGADYEAKEITVHKVLCGSPADRDARIQKGDRILSINGKSMKGATHRESLAILKQPRPEVVLVVSRLKAEGAAAGAAVGAVGAGDTSLHQGTDDVLMSGVRASLNGGISRPPRILEGSLLNDPAMEGEDGGARGARGTREARGPATSIQLTKDGAGLGFSLEGGKDSPLGDRPLVVKKIFTGGAAEKSGVLKAGDEIVNVNGVDVSLMSRIEAWKLMKRIPDGSVSLIIRRLL